MTTRSFAPFMFYILATVVFIQPLAISQESSEYESLIKGMEEFKGGNYQKALKEFFVAAKNFPVKKMTKMT